MLVAAALASSAAAARGDALQPPAGLSPVVRYQPGAIVVQLTAASSAAVRPVRAAAPHRLSALGIASLDRVAGELGGATFEPEFRGERDPGLAAFYIVHLPAGVSHDLAVGRFGALSEVATATPISITRVAAVVAPNDSLWSYAYHLYQPSRRDIHALEAWGLTTGDSSIVVGVLDTGVIPYHPDIGGSVAGWSGNLWTNVAERDGLPGVDDDGNGYVDDVHGWDFVDLPSGDGIIPGEDWRDADNDPNDFTGHGTGVAGVIAGLTNNHIGIAGVAPNVRIMPLRVGYSSDAEPPGEVSITFAAQAIVYATRMGASVLNLSFSTDEQPDIDAAFNLAVRSGVTLVLAAGNNGIASVLTARRDVVTVAATDNQDVVTAFSNRGSQVDLSAPGLDIPSTSIIRPGTDSVMVRQPYYITDWSGTSFSAPMVAGAAALIQSYRKQQGLRPLNPLEMLFRLRDTADDISLLNPAGGYGTGRLNVYRALTDPPSSMAVRMGALSVGPPLVLPTLSGHPRIAVATTDEQVLFLDGASGDTARVVALPGDPIGFMAAADLGGGLGTALFVATQQGQIAGLTATGDPLPGWPVTVGSGSSTVVGGPALGDLDGDGKLEIVAGTVDGSLWAWRADGTRLPAFPIQNLGVSQPVALTPIDADPGAEVVLVSGLAVHAIRWDGTEPPGWPIAARWLVNLAPPVVTATGADHMPTVFVTQIGGVESFGADGRPRREYLQPGMGGFEPAIGDLNGDGEDELVAVVLGSAFLMVVLDPDSLGSGGFPGWPVGLDQHPQSPPLLAHVSTNPAPDVIMYESGGLVAVSATGQPVPRFPPPLIAGRTSTVADVDGDGAAEVVAGTNRDSLLAVFDMGPGTWNPALSPWPTLRGNAARTGSRLYAPPLALIDDTPPAPVADLSADSVAAIGATLRWSAPLLPNGQGAGSVYEVRSSTAPITATNFGVARLAGGAPLPGPAGGAQRFRITSLAPGSRNWIALRSRDRAGSWSAISNVIQVVTGPIVPPPVADLRVAAATDSSVQLAWTATAAEQGLIHAARYEIRAAPRPIRPGDFANVQLRWTVPGSAAPGATQVATVGGLAAARDYWIAVRGFDAFGNASAVASAPVARTDVGGPLAGQPGVALAPRMQPARAPLDLFWRGAGGGAAPQHIRFYDLSGRQMRELPLGPEAGGIAQWDGRDQNGRLVPAGIYFARLTSGSFHAKARVVLLP